MVQREILQMLGVPHDHVDHQVVAACHQEGEAHLRYLDDVVHEAVDHAALVLGQLDHEERFKSDAQRPRIHVDMCSAQHAGIAQPLDPFMG